MGDIGNGHRLGAVFLADPVSIRKIDADRGGRIASAAETGSVYHLGTHAFDTLFLETRINRRIVLKPLGIGTEQFGAR